MSRGNELVHPVTDTKPKWVRDAGHYQLMGEVKCIGGMTLREHFAGLAMQGLVGNTSGNPGKVAVYAVKVADALLVELERSHDAG